MDQSDLIGSWKSDPTDPKGKDAYGEVSLRFEADGTLLYIARGPDKDQVMRLTYRLEPGMIITDQPSQPRSERTIYKIAEDGALILAFGGQESRYVRAK